MQGKKFGKGAYFHRSKVNNHGSQTPRSAAPDPNAPTGSNSNERRKIRRANHTFPGQPAEYTNERLELDGGDQTSSEAGHSQNTVNQL